MSATVTIAQMRLLTAFDSHTSLGGVATHLGLSQPTVSQNLSTLEARLGMTLVERTRSGSNLTEQGRAVVVWAQGLLRESDRLDGLLSHVGHEARGRLRVAASLTIAEYLMPHWLLDAADGASGRSDLDLSVANSEHVMELVERRSVELGFIEGHRIRAGLRSGSVGRDRLTVVVRPQHPWAARREPIGVDEFLLGELIVREPGSGTREVFDRALGRLGRELGSVITMGSTSTIKTAVRASEAVGVISRLAVQDELRAGALAEVTIAGLVLDRNLRVVWVGDLGRDTRMSRLIAAARRTGSGLADA